jgi:hypothetical protein
VGSTFTNTNIFPPDGVVPANGCLDGGSKGIGAVNVGDVAWAIPTAGDVPNGIVLMSLATNVAGQYRVRVCNTTNSAIDVNFPAGDGFTVRIPVFR